MEKSPEILLTADGSPTLYLSRFDETYHSRHGAVQESRHVFIEAGLQKVMETFKAINILEIGFGTGLNALLSYAETIKRTDIQIEYTGLEPFPIDIDLAMMYLRSLPENLQDYAEAYQCMHQQTEGKTNLGSRFTLEREKRGLEANEVGEKYQLVYHDAFAPRVQPELWTEQTFRLIASQMVTGGVWVSYCAKGAVRRALTAAGFQCERLPGPPGKREMLRATKR
jgi:tRNA U34 5-methylaminomethyl-2-thiouridine-forming methyltransferase MnmC